MRTRSTGMLLAVLAFPCAGGELVTGFQKSLANDATYQAAKAEFDGNRISADRAGRAYWPELSFKLGERSEVQGSQRTIQIAQPLVDADRYATWRGAGALELRAESTMRLREAELIQRYYKSVLDLVRAREQLVLNNAKADALRQQVVAAERGLAGGLGTVTDVLDVKLRLNQAGAEQLTLQAQLEAATRQFQAMTGEPPRAGAFQLNRARRGFMLPVVNDMIEAAKLANPQVIAAMQTQRLAELDLTRKYGAFLPKLNLIAKQSRVADGQAVSFIGVMIDLPFQSGNLLDVSGAKAGIVKATEELRAVRNRAALEVQRLHALVANGRMELDLRRQAIETAEAGLEANEKSFRGGVRSKIDVLNSIQVLFQARDDYVGARLTLGENFVALHAVVDTPSTDVLMQVENLLF